MGKGTKKQRKEDQELRDAVNERMREITAYRMEALDEARLRSDVLVDDLDLLAARRYVSKVLWSTHDPDLVREISTQELVLSLYTRGVIGAARHRVDKEAKRRKRAAKAANT